LIYFNIYYIYVYIELGIKMLDSIKHIGTALKAARQKKKFSQRILSTKTGVPQSHISKIENGATDLQTSSLIEISRALDLELMLVPRDLALTFQALLTGVKKGSQKQVPIYRLEQEEEEDV